MIVEILNLVGVLLDHSTLSASTVPVLTGAMCPEKSLESMMSRSCDMKVYIFKGHCYRCNSLSRGERYGMELEMSPNA